MAVISCRPKCVKLHIVVFQFCPATTDDDGTFITVHVLSTLVAVLILILLGLLVVYKYRIWIKLVLYIRCGWRPADVSDDMDIEDKVTINNNKAYHYSGHQVTGTIVLMSYLTATYLKTGYP